MKAKKIKLLVVDDDPGFADRIRRDLVSTPFIEVVGVDPRNPCRSALDWLEKQGDLTCVYLLVDLHLQSLLTGLRDDHGGDLFVDHLLVVKYANLPWMKDHIIVYSSYPGHSGAEHSARLAVRRIWKLYLPDLLRTDLVGRIQAEQEANCSTGVRLKASLEATARWCYRNPSIRETYAGKIVAASQQRVWGCGEDADAAWAAAAKTEGCPARDKLIFVFIPPSIEQVLGHAKGKLPASLAKRRGQEHSGDLKSAD